MRKLLLLLFLFISLISCEEKDKYELTYVVHYYNVSDTVKVSSPYQLYWYSTDGVNYIKEFIPLGLTDKSYYVGNMPYEILSYNILK